ncbi:MAG TPA: outer membrane beta-barrel protein [Arsenicitalea sp.]|jgi:opacity protein-like surface antigen|nr:outer membrane beta-barrel protein [Arsenicitalea sp.]
MLKKLVLAALFLAPGSAMAQSMPSIDNFYIQGYGGLRAGDNLNLNGAAQDLNFGTAFGVSIGADSGIPGLTFDLDYMRTSANYSAMGTALDSQSLMLDGQWTYNLSNGFNIYGAAGAGVIGVTYAATNSGNAFGYQLKAGVSAALTDQISWFGEYRYQQAIGNVSVGTPAQSAEYASHSILAGLKLSFGGNGSSVGGGGGGSGGSFSGSSY